jgi:molybdopterin/thiamine biosynthesis adenylyltransferase
MSAYLKPRLKSFVEFCLKNEKIYFFAKPNIAIELTDSNQFIFNVCKLMDGVKNFDEITQSLYPSYPKEVHFLEDLLKVLDKEYLLEDVSKNFSRTLSQYDIDRWSRNIEFFSSYCKATENKYFLQEKLQEVKVAIFGLGGVGSNVLYNLIAMGVNHIVAIDYDTVELPNLNRQIIYNESDIGRLKSIAAKERINDFINNKNIKFINKKITCSDDISHIIHDYDYVITAIDQPRDKIMDWFNLACVGQSKPFFCGALDNRVAIYYVITPGKSGCIECWKKNKKTSFLFQDLLQEKNFISANSANLAMMPMISILSGLMANEFLKVVTGIGSVKPEGKLHSFDFFTSQITIAESWQKHPDCPIC